MDPNADSNPSEQADDAWLDDALAQSFPASDPLPSIHHDDNRGAFKEDWELSSEG